jgi:hypothetical protein
MKNTAGGRCLLMRELDVQRRAGYAVVNRLPIRGRPAPRKVDLVQVAFYLAWSPTMMPAVFW